MEKINFKEHEGQVVEKGSVMFEIDPRPYQEAVLQLEANIERDKAHLAQAEAGLTRATMQEAHATRQSERYEKLAAEGIFSREQADQMTVAMRASPFTCAAARDSVAVTRTRGLRPLSVDNCTSCSPSEGSTCSM